MKDVFENLIVGGLPSQPSVVPVGGRILDVGCGHGASYRLFDRAAVEYDGLDASAELIADARRRHPDHLATFRVGSPLALPYDDLTFDVVLLRLPTFSLAASKRRRALAEARRVLRPGGYLLLAPRGRLAGLPLVARLAVSCLARSCRDTGFATSRSASVVVAQRPGQLDLTPYGVTGL